MATATFFFADQAGSTVQLEQLGRPLAGHRLDAIGLGGQGLRAGRAQPDP